MGLLNGERPRLLPSPAVPCGAVSYVQSRAHKKYVHRARLLGDATLIRSRFEFCELPGRPVPLPPSSLTSPTPPPSTRSVTTLMQKSGVPCCSQAQATAAASMSLTLASVNYRPFPRRGGANTRVAEGTHHRAARSPLVCCHIFCPTELYSPQSRMCASASHFTCTYLGSWKRV